MSPNVLPEQRQSPPEPQPNPQVSRLDYEYQPPQERLRVAQETLVGLSECALALRFLDQADPAGFDNFKEGGSEIIPEFDCFKAIEKVKKMLREYVDEKVRPWL